MRMRKGLSEKSGGLYSLFIEIAFFVVRDWIDRLQGRREASWASRGVAGRTDV